MQAPEKTGGKDQSNSRVERLFGKIKKLPKKSNFLENFGVGPLSLDPISDKLEERKFDKEVDKDEKQQLIKIVGLDPKHLFEKIGKYKLNLQRMPKFSN